MYSKVFKRDYPHAYIASEWTDGEHFSINAFNNATGQFVRVGIARLFGHLYIDTDKELSRENDKYDIATNIREAIDNCTRLMKDSVEDDPDGYELYFNVREKLFELEAILNE